MPEDIKSSDKTDEERLLAEEEKRQRDTEARSQKTKERRVKAKSKSKAKTKAKAKRIDSIDSIEYTTSDSETKTKKTNATIKVYETAEQIKQHDTIFVDQFRNGWAFVNIKDHMELINLESQRFEHWVYRKLVIPGSLSPILPKPVQVQTVLAYLKAHAEFDAERRILYLRVAIDDHDHNTIHYDLTNEQWQVVKIIPEGWLIEEKPTVMFRRQNNQLPQVMPSRDYDKNTFDKFINLLNINREEHKLLLKCYIIALLISDIPKAILMLHGEPNSAKTTCLELIRMLIDQVSTKTLSIKSVKNNDNAEIVQQLDHNYLPYYDNISFIPEWLSDILCRASTGDSFSKRKLFTNNDDILYSYIRNVGFSGVNLAATKSDLLRRGLIIELERIQRDNQKQVKLIWKEFQDLRPKVLGYIFDILAQVLKMKRQGVTVVGGLPSLSDWGEWCELISQAMGNKPGEFITVFNKNIESQNEAAIEDSVIAETIIKFMEDKTEWTGTSGMLLTHLEFEAPALGINIKDRKTWPARPNVLKKWLKYVISNLKEAHNITIREADDSSTKSKRITIEKHEIQTNIGISPIPSIHRYSGQNRAQNEGNGGIDESIDESVDTNQSSIPENSQNRAQNQPGIDGIDSIDKTPLIAQNHNHNKYQHQHQHQRQQYLKSRGITNQFPRVICVSTAAIPIVRHPYYLTTLTVGMVLNGVLAEPTFTWSAITSMTEHCSVCSDVFDDIFELRYHLIERHNWRRCSTCSETFGDEFDRMDHIQKRHNRFQCAFCHDSFNKRLEFDYHLQKKHAIFCNYHARARALAKTMITIITIVLACSTVNLEATP